MKKINSEEKKKYQGLRREQEYLMRLCKQLVLSCKHQWIRLSTLTICIYNFLRCKVYNKSNHDNFYIERTKPIPKVKTIRHYTIIYVPFVLKFKWNCNCQMIKSKDVVFDLLFYINRNHYVKAYLTYHYLKYGPFYAEKIIIMYLY